MLSRKSTVASPSKSSPRAALTKAYAACSRADMAAGGGNESARAPTRRPRPRATSEGVGGASWTASALALLAGHSATAASSAAASSPLSARASLRGMRAERGEPGEESQERKSGHPLRADLDGFGLALGQISTRSRPDLDLISASSRLDLGPQSLLLAHPAVEGCRGGPGAQRRRRRLPVPPRPRRVRWRLCCRLSPQLLLAQQLLLELVVGRRERRERVALSVAAAVPSAVASAVEASDRPPSRRSLLGRETDRQRERLQMAPSPSGPR